MIYLIIYLIGYIISYIILRKIAYLNRDWRDIKISAILSILSYLTLIAAIIVIIQKKLDNTKPPKWL